MAHPEENRKLWDERWDRICTNLEDFTEAMREHSKILERHTGDLLEHRLVRDIQTSAVSELKSRVDVVEKWVWRAAGGLVVLSLTYPLIIQSLMRTAGQ